VQLKRMFEYGRSKLQLKNRLVAYVFLVDAEKRVRWRGCVPFLSFLLLEQINSSVGSRLTQSLYSPCVQVWVCPRARDQGDGQGRR
jgi:hypothetical protein